MKLREVLLDAKKAVGVAVTMAGAAAAAGIIDNAVAAEITGIAGVVATGVAYWLRNIDKPAPAAQPAPTPPAA